MSAFERIQSYSRNSVSQNNNIQSEVEDKIFDITTPEGYLLNRLHTDGYKMFTYIYKDSSGNELTDSDIDSMDSESKKDLVKSIKMTELYNALTTNGDQLILSAAGSGKTSCLIFKIMKDIVTGEVMKSVTIPDGQTVRVLDSIFVGTFLKSGAEELKQKLTAWQRKIGYSITSDRVTFSTLHAEFKRALNDMGVKTPIAKDSDLFKYICKSVDSLGITRDGSKLNKEDYFIIQSIITFYRSRLDDKKYSHPSCSEYGLTPTVLDMIVRDYSYQKKVDNAMDFEDLQDLLYQYLYVTPNKAVQDFIANRYKYIYLDEFQDTSQVQYAILKFYARGRLKQNKIAGFESLDDENLKQLYTGIETLGKITVIGDDDQCIYGWRGSDVEIICNDFDKDFAPCISELTVNYRCPENVLNAIVPSIIKNTRRASKQLKSSKKGGEFNAYAFTNIKNMLSQLSLEIEKDMNNNNSVAIICRTNFDGMIPAFMLEMKGKYDYSISGDNMTLNSPLPKKILAVTSIFTERSTMAVRNTLEMFVPRYAQWKVKELVQTLKNDDTVSNRASIWNLPEADIEYSCPEILSFVRDIKSIIYNEQGVKDRKLEVEGLKYIYCWLTVNVFGGDSAYCMSARAYIDALLYLLDSKDFESVFDFLDTVNMYNERLHARIKKKGARIDVVTVHEFKGKERDCTYIWNDSEGVFPSSKTDIDDIDQLEEERRVHYIACTRARVKNVILFLQGKAGLFLNEMQVKAINPTAVRGSLKGNKTTSSVIEDEQNKIDELLKDVDFSNKLVL